ncbi:MAG: hypothetical protein M1828_004184 [Chrysothrix sp. TS-e1954]|nr:MAG: hypothetical protein M1828_004184 [Chrysothrix sp. TS-e1954]
MYVPNSTLLALMAYFSGLVSATPVPDTAAVDAAAAPCATGVHIFITRGTGDETDANQGQLHTVADNIISRIDNSTVRGIAYPDSKADPRYNVSEAAGVANLRSSIQSYATRCPKTAIVLLGYSQGAQVTPNTLCGTSEAGFDSTPRLPTDLDSHIESVVVMGDPSHVTGTIYDKGTSMRDGKFPRQDLAGCAPFRGRIQSYCDTGDQFCDNAMPPIMGVHGGYVAEYGSQAENFVVDMHKSASA